MTTLENIIASEQRLISIAKKAYDNRNDLKTLVYYEDSINEERKYMDEQTNLFLIGNNTKASDHDNY